MTRLKTPLESRDTRVLLRDHHTRQNVDHAIRELRARRVSYRAIGQALDVFTGLAMTEQQVRYRCRKLGLTPTDRWPTR